MKVEDILWDYAKTFQGEGEVSVNMSKGETLVIQIDTKILLQRLTRSFSVGIEEARKLMVKTSAFFEELTFPKDLLLHNGEFLRIMIF